MTTSQSTLPVTIRPFGSDDESALIKLWQSCGLTRPWNDPSRDIARKMAVQPELFFVAQMGMQVVGSLMGGYDGHRGWAYYLAVHPEHRRRGIARNLMTTLESALLEMGCPKLNIMVREDNAAAQGFYNKVGYGRDAVSTLSRRLIPDQHMPE